MGKAASVTAGLMMAWMLVGCGGPVDESTELPVAQAQLDAPSHTSAAVARPPYPYPYPEPLPYCWNLNGTSCTSAGSITSCTDGYYTDYTCTCGTDWRWHCQDVR